MHELEDLVNELNDYEKYKFEIVSSIGFNLHRLSCESEINESIATESFKLIDLLLEKEIIETSYQAKSL